MGTKRNGTPVDLGGEVDFHAAGSTETGLRALLALHRHDELSVMQIAEHAGMSLVNASLRLNRWHDRGLVIRRAEGTSRLYSIAPAYRDAVAQVAERVGSTK